MQGKPCETACARQIEHVHLFSLNRSFAHNVWDIPTEGKTEREMAEAGLQALKDWMLEIGLPLTISELGATADMIPGITETTVIYPAGYLDLTKEDITEILKESM